MNKELKKRHLAELNALESQYQINLDNLKLISESQSDLRSRMQIILNKFKNENI